MANQNPTANSQTITLASAIYKIQLSLIDTPSTSFSLLLHAGTLLAEPDYEDVVTERNISNLCGYPSCQNPRKFNTKRSKSPKYRISLKEHKVYDLQEGYKYCGEDCLISSRAFKESLDAQRRAEVDLSRKKVEDVLRLFGYYDGKEEDGKKKDLKKLEILEKEEAGASEINLDGVMANAIEGYVPKYNSGSKFAPTLETEQQIGAQTSVLEVDNAITSDKTIGSSPRLSSTSTDDVSDMITKMLEDVSITEGNFNESCLKSHRSKTQKKEVNKNVVVVNNGDMGFTSSIIFGNELDATLPKTCDVSEQISKQLDDLLMSEKTPSKSEPFKSPRSEPTNKVNNNKSEKAKPSSSLTGENSIKQSAPTTSSKSKDSNHDARAEDVSKSIGISSKKEEVSQNNCLKPSLKTSKSKGKNQSVKWADVKKRGTLQNNGMLETTQGGNTDPRIASAEACVAALSRAADAVASGEAEVVDAVSEAGIVILPQPQQDENAKSDANEDKFDYEREVFKWPKKTVLLETDMFEVEDSWHDTVPEGFSLTLSTFATMWMALSSWITCSSIAYIYGHDDNSEEDFLYVNGTEYPHKVFIINGKSSEIRLALDGFISRALPGLVMDLGLPTPVSTLGKYVARLLDTMSFVETLPSFRMKQWQTIVLLFIEALTVSRLPSLAPQLTGHNMQLKKVQVLQGAKVSMEEFEIMREFIMPLARLPR